MNTLSIVNILKDQFTTYTFYNNFIKDGKCVGVYSRGDAPDVVSIGGRQNNGYYIKPIQLLVHWSEDADESETVATSLWSFLSEFYATVNNEVIRTLQMLEPCPIELGRDEKNICEFSIRVNLIISHVEGD